MEIYVKGSKRLRDDLDFKQIRDNPTTYLATDLTTGQSVMMRQTGTGFWEIFEDEYESISALETANLSVQVRLIKAMGRQYHISAVARMVYQLWKLRQLDALHKEWHIENDNLYKLIKPGEAGIPQVHVDVESHVEYLLGEWRWKPNIFNRSNLFPNANTVGGPVYGVEPHHNFNGERIQIMNGPYKLECGRTLGFDSEGGLILKLDNGVEIWANEYWWIHRHDHCNVTCPICNEVFIIAWNDSSISNIKESLYEIREKILAIR